MIQHVRPARRPALPAAALLAAVLATAPAACSSSDSTLGSGPPSSSTVPAAHDARIFTGAGVVEVGDTMTVYVQAFDSAGRSTAIDAPTQWWFNPGGIATLHPLGAAGQNGVLSGLSPGATVLNASLAGVTATSDSVYVIPVLRAFVFTPSSLSLHMGDSARVTVRVTTRDTDDPIPERFITWESGNRSIAVPIGSGATVWVHTVPNGGTTGATEIRAKVGNRVGSVPVTVTAP